MHTYLHTRMHTYKHTSFIHACMHAYIHACIHTYIQTYIHACMHACIHPSIHKHTHTHIMHMFACVCRKFYVSPQSWSAAAGTFFHPPSRYPDILFQVFFFSSTDQLWTCMGGLSEASNLLVIVPCLDQTSTFDAQNPRCSFTAAC